MRTCANPDHGKSCNCPTIPPRGHRFCCKKCCGQAHETGGGREWKQDHQSLRGRAARARKRQTDVEQMVRHGEWLLELLNRTEHTPTIPTVARDGLRRFAGLMLGGGEVRTKP